jgi:hypothetical protein
MGDLLRGLILPGGDLAGVGELLLKEVDLLLRERLDHFLRGVLLFRERLLLSRDRLLLLEVDCIASSSKALSISL